MSLVISDPKIVERIHQLAEKLNQTPEQVIYDAMEYYCSQPARDDKMFWNAIRGIGDSGDPDLAQRVKDILRKEVDPIQGWSSQPSDSGATEQ